MLMAPLLDSCYWIFFPDYSVFSETYDTKLQNMLLLHFSQNLHISPKLVLVLRRIEIVFYFIITVNSTQQYKQWSSIHML